MEKHVAYIKLDLISLYPSLPYWKNIYIYVDRHRTKHNAQMMSVTHRPNMFTPKPS